MPRGRLFCFSLTPPPLYHLISLSSLRWYFLTPSTTLFFVLLRFSCSSPHYLYFIYFFFWGEGAGYFCYISFSSLHSPVSFLFSSPLFYPLFYFILFSFLLSFLLSSFLFSPFRVPSRCLPFSFLRSHLPFVLPPSFHSSLRPSSFPSIYPAYPSPIRRSVRPHKSPVIKASEARALGRDGCGRRGGRVTPPDRGGRGRSVSGGRDQVTIWEEASEALGSAALAFGSGV